MIVGALLLVGGFTLFTATLVAVGAIMPTARDAGQISAPLMILIFVPFYAVSLVVSDPHALIVQLFTYFPYTAPVTAMLRNGFGSLSPLEATIVITELFVLGVVMPSVSRCGCSGTDRSSTRGRSRSGRCSPGSSDSAPARGAKGAILSDSDVRLDRLMDSLKDPFVFCDASHLIRYMNRAAVEHYAGRPASVGRSIFECHNEESNERIREVCALLIDGADEVLITDDDRHRVYMRAVRDGSGEFVGYYERYEPPA